LLLLCSTAKIGKKIMFTLNSNGKQLNMHTPLIMGVLNCTDDSFFEGSRSLQLTELQIKIDQMIEEGVDIIDVGGQSTRPGAAQIEIEQEILRIKGALNYIKSTYPNKWISIDTTRSEVASFAIHHGADIVNDISAGNMDNKMLSTVANLKAPYICMHMQGRPETMQIAPHYGNVTEEVISFFKAKIDEMRQAGIKEMILDPGFGFGKTIEHNYQMMNELEMFHQLNLPLLVGISRKSMIYKLLGSSPEEALNGTTSLNTVALMKGAHILRVHDVKAAREVVQLFKQLSSK
jgi:dihydropteroate synthase